MSITKISPSVVDFDAGITISTADNTDTLTLTSTDADANSGPNLNLYRNSGSPADNDVLGYLKFTGVNDNSEIINYARIRTDLTDASDGTEDGSFYIFAMNAGTERTRVSVLPSETVFNDESQDVDFRIESNGDDKQFTILGDKFGVGIGRYPENAYNGYSSIELGQQGIIMANDSAYDIWFASNLYLDSSANQNKKSTGVSGLLRINGDVLEWFTSASGSADTQNSWTTRVRLDSDGGIKFGSDTAAANALDDYEEGTWSVDLIGCDDNLSSPTGHYTKIGRLVYFYWYSGAFTISNQSGVAFIDGLPFTTRSNSGQAYSTFQYLHGDAVDGNSTGGYVEHSATKIRFIDAGTTDSASYVNGARYIMVSGIYEAA